VLGSAAAYTPDLITQWSHRYKNLIVFVEDFSTNLWIETEQTLASDQVKAE